MIGVISLDNKLDMIESRRFIPPCLFDCSPNVGEGR